MLKKYIQALLEGFLASKRAWVSSQAIPSTTVFDVGAAPNDEYTPFVAPTDGYIVGRLIGASKIKTMQIEVGQAPGIWQCNDNLSSRYWGFSVPVKKGTHCTILFRYEGYTEESINLFFVPTNGSV